MLLTFSRFSRAKIPLHAPLTRRILTLSFSSLAIVMIQSLMFAFLFSLLSLFSSLNLNATQSFSASESTTIQHVHFSSHPFFVDRDAAILTTRHESPRVSGLRLISDDDEETSAETTLLFYTLSTTAFVVICSLYIGQSTHVFVRKALQFSNLYSRFAHA